MLSEEQILNVLIQYNPWWKGLPVTDKMAPSHHRFAYYEAKKMLLHQDLRRFVILSGPRRVGKTTILFQLIKNLLLQNVSARNIFYLSFDNPVLKLAGFEETIRVYKNAYPAGDKCYFFIDEVQYAQDWEGWIKTLYDTNPDLRVIATESASPVLEKGSAESGVGRWSILKIPTLSFYEYCDLLQIPVGEPLPTGIQPTKLNLLETGDFNEMMARLSPLYQYFNRYLTVGGFPELALAGDETLSKKLLREDVVDKVLKRDILSLHNIRNPLQFEKVFLYLCMHSSSIINVSTMTKELEDINKITLLNYIDYLKQANLIYISDPLNVDGKGILKGRSKIYVADPAIRNAVLMLENVIADPVEMGIMVETAAYKHIVAYYSSANIQVGYYRRVKDNKKEVDIVAGLPTGKFLCEVKYREQASVKTSDALFELVNSEKAKVQGAVLITKRAEDYGIAAHNSRIPVIRIPAFAFLYLLGHAEKERVLA